MLRCVYTRAVTACTKVSHTKARYQIPTRGYSLMTCRYVQNLIELCAEWRPWVVGDVCLQKSTSTKNVFRV